MQQSTTETLVQRDIFTVSRLGIEIRAVLEGSFPLIWVEGEISNLSNPKSGHLYFSLKDPHAQVRCAMFRNRRNLLRFQPGNGDMVLIRARVSFYEARGDFQLIAEHMEPSGEGALQRAFEELKNKLGQEGLFEASHKQPIPDYPTRLGLITSPTGAAIHDILSVLKRRFPALDVRIYPSSVQGKDAAEELIAALSAAENDGDCDLLILTRGGGSLEDLAAFNDEQLARTIYALKTPVISAVGHEIDFTIADFVADRRAPTPSAAAELASPDGAALQGWIKDMRNKLARHLENRLQRDQALVKQASGRLKRLHPRARLEQHQQRLDELSATSYQSIRQHIRISGYQKDSLLLRLRAVSPYQRLNEFNRESRRLHGRLDRAMSLRIEHIRTDLKHQIIRLQDVSPLATLSRGYSILLTKDEGKLVREINAVTVGDSLTARVSDGAFSVRVVAKE